MGEKPTPKKEVKVEAEKPSSFAALSESIVANDEELRGRVTTLAQTCNELGQTWQEFVFTLKGVMRALGKDFNEEDAMEQNEPRAYAAVAETADNEGNVDARFKDTGGKVEEIRFREPGKEKWGDYIAEASSLYDVPQMFLLTVARMESGFDERAANGSHRGLGQIGHAEEMAFKSCPDCPSDIAGKNFDIWKPRHNWLATAWLLNQKKEEVDRRVERGEFPDDYRVGGKPMTAEGAGNWWRAYHDGARGYLVARKYKENPTSENRSELAGFQKKPGALDGFDRYAKKLGKQFLAYQSAEAAGDARIV